MPSLEAIRQRAVVKVSSAITGIIGTEFKNENAQLVNDTSSLSKRFGFERGYAIHYLLNAKEKLTELNISLAIEKWDVDQKVYIKALNGARKDLIEGDSSALGYTRSALRKEEENANAAHSLRVACESIKAANFNIELMISSWKRYIASKGFWLLIIAVVIATAIIYYLAFGGDAAVQQSAKVGATFSEKASANFDHVTSIVHDSTGFVEKFTKLLSEIEKLFSVWPAFALAAGGVIKLLAKRL
jgi:hypothetical protein